MHLHTPVPATRAKYLHTPEFIGGGIDPKSCRRGAEVASKLTHSYFDIDFISTQEMAKPNVRVAAAAVQGGCLLSEEMTRLSMHTCIFWLVSVECNTLPIEILQRIYQTMLLECRGGGGARPFPNPDLYSISRLSLHKGLS